MIKLVLHLVLCVTGNLSSPLASNLVVLSKISKSLGISQVLIGLFLVSILAIHINNLIKMQNCKHKALATDLYPILQMSRSSGDISEDVSEFLL
jgi:hypothetical protein